MDESSDPTLIEAAVADGVAHGVIDLDVISVVGPDSEDYLQGQLSQNVLGVAVGETRWTLLLQPQGKVAAWMRIHRPAADLLWLVVDGGHGEEALARLERFKLRVDATFTLDQRRAVALRGPSAQAVVDRVGAVSRDDVSQDDVSQDDVSQYAAVNADWGGIAGVDLVPRSEATSDGVADLAAVTADNHMEVDDDGLELVRILQGRPLMGRELNESTIPAAAGIVNESTDFTKGCYVGQELVARIDSRGSNTPTRLVRVTAAEGSVPPAGSAIVVEDKEGGSITSAAARPGGGSVALAYVKRNVDVPGPAAVVGPDGDTIPVELETLSPTSPNESA